MKEKLVNALSPIHAGGNREQSNKDGRNNENTLTPERVVARSRAYGCSWFH